MMHYLVLLVLSCSLLFGSVLSMPGRRAGTYKNPIVPGGGADPWVLQHGSSYYLTYTTGGDVQLRKSANLAQWSNIAAKVVYTPPAGYGAVWAPELHYIQGQFYVYVAMATNNGDNAKHRMYVLKGRSQEPLDGFDLVGQIGTPDNNWAIDGTVLIYGNGNLYFIWSGWTDNNNQLWQNLYIAKMDSPTKITQNRVLLHQPNPSWQQTIDGGGVHGINEGPEILVHNGRTFLLYSVAGSWTQDYSIAMMGIDGGADPLVVSNWWTLDTRPVFWKSSTAFGPGHASFPFSPNGTPYIVYHAMADPNAGWDGRTIRTQTFGWNADGSPAFPSPSSLDTVFNLPA